MQDASRKGGGPRALRPHIAPLRLREQAGRGKTEAKLVERIVDGNDDALAEAFELHAEVVFRTAYGILRSRPDAEDVVQDIFSTLPERLTRFKGRSSLSTWLHRVSVRCALERLRRDRSWKRLRAKAARRVPPPIFPRPIDRIDLERALHALPEKYRVVIWLKIVEGWSHAEIAEACGISENASYQRLHRARRLLHGLMGGRND